MNSTIYSVPDGERPYGGYAVTVDGAKAPVSEVRCSTIPFNRRWPGHQRQIEQTELCGMVRFAFKGKATVAVTPDHDFKEVKVRPLSRGVTVRREGRTVTFDIERPGGYSVEFDGYHNNLHVFADAPKDYDLPPNAIVFGPGVHDIGILTLKSGDTVFIDSGAIVYGGFHAKDATGISILGRGIIDGGRLKEEILFPASGDGNEDVKNAKRVHTIDLRNCRDIVIDGPTMRDSLLYNIAMWGCENIAVSNVKIVGQWRFNTDGIDLHNCRHARVTDCFARTFDDTFCFKAHEGYGNCEDCVFERCVAWNDWGKAFEVGVECRADHLRRLTFRDCDCIHAVGAVMDVANVDYGRVSDILFEDMRLECDERMPCPQMQKTDDSPFDATAGLDRLPRLFQSEIAFHHEYSRENGGKWSGGGFIDGVTLCNVSIVTDGRKPSVSLHGLDEGHRPENIVFEGLSVNGGPVQGVDGIVLYVSGPVDGPKFTASAAAAPARKIKVACIGDSITYGYLLDHPERDAFPAQLQRMLGDGYDVRNFGVPGLGVYLHLPWHSANGRRAWSLSPECSQALAWEPDVVISNLGANDLEEYPREALSSPDGTPALAHGTFRTQYAAVLKAFKADGRKPRILMWTRLCAMKAENVAKYGASLAAIADDLQAVAAEAGAEGFDAYAVTATSAQTEDWPDATHPPASVHRALAEALLAALRQGEGGASARTEDWPLIVIRHTSGVNNLPDIFGQLADCHRRHPGACDEFWFATGSRKTIPALEEECAKFAAYRNICNEIDVIPSYQQGLTLGHGAAHDGPPKPNSQVFPEDAWQVGRDGQRIGFLCPRSPFVLDYEFNYAKTVMRVADPGSYWIDDDLRLGIHKPEGCFCDRCIAAFNAKTGGNWTRETLVARLFSDAPREPLRAAWIDFNAESLAVYGAKAREAADALDSPCRLAYQAVWADTIYTASSYRPLLEALSGPAHKPVGIRPGAGFYTEAEPRGMVSKCLSVAREAERCRRYGDLVASVCYEQETYPRHVLHKSPGAIMTECALALASGCNSLSLYWYAGEAPEPIEEYGRFLKTLNSARPYFERLAASTRRTRLGGVARFVGSAAAETPDFDLRDQKDFDLACAGIPVTVAESGTKVWYLTDKSRREMTEADEAVLASGAVVDVGDVGKYPLASRRTKLLDDLDAVTDGTFPVRVDACRPLRILPRVRDDERLDSVTLLNLSIGDTDELKIRVRRPVSPKALLQTAKMDVPIHVVCEASELLNEYVIALDNLQGWQTATLFFA